MTTPKRPGFTLIELLMVVGIIVLIATILVPVALRMTERSQISTGISAVQGYLAQAKARAIATKKANGIRLLAMEPQDRTVPGGPALAWYDRVEFIESPGDYNEGFVWAYLPTVPPSPRQANVPCWRNNAPMTYAGLDVPAQVVTVNVPAGIPLLPNRLYGAVNGLNFSASAWPGFPGPAGMKQVNPFSFSPTANMQALVEAGDLVEISGVGQLYRIINVNFNSGIVPTYLDLDRNLPHDIPMPISGAPNYRVIRQPRPVPGTLAQKLPGEVVIDLIPPTNGVNVVAPNDRDQNATNPQGEIWMRGVSRGLTITYPLAATPANIAPRYVDIVFDAAGQLVPNGRTFNAAGTEGYFMTSDGVVYLWVHPAGAPGAWSNRSPGAAAGDADNQAIISINARTGAIGSYRIDQDAATANPWANAQRGRADGVGGL